MASYVDRYLLNRARRGTDVLGRPLPETDAGMMELRKQQAEQERQDLQTQVAQQELLKVQQERNRLNQGTEELIDFPLGDGRFVKVIKVTSPDGPITFKRPEFKNLLGEPPTTTSNTNVLADVLSGNNRNQPAMAASPTLADQFKDAGLPVVEPTRKRIGTPFRQGDKVLQLFETPGGSPEAVELQGSPLDYGLKRTRDNKAASLLNPAERKAYYDPNIPQAEFDQLNQKAVTLLADEERTKANIPTQAETDSAFFYNQMMGATPILERLELDENSEEFLSDITGTFAALKRNIKTAEGFKTEKEKQYLNAASAWTAAKLRRESGAAIGPDEFAQEYARFFPVIGDGPDTIAQKREQRRIAQQSMLTAAGRAAPKSKGTGTTSEGTETNSERPPPGGQSFSLPPKLLEMTYEQLGQLNKENLQMLGLYEAVRNRMKELKKGK